MFPDIVCRPEVEVPSSVEQNWSDIDARLTLLRGLLEISGPITPAEVATLTGLTIEQASAGLEGLEGEGVVLRGRFRTFEIQHDDEPPSAATDVEWCHRRLLSRIHRMTVAGLRREIEPVDVAVFLEFLCRHHGIISEDRSRGVNGVHDAVAQLQGLDIPAVAWERDILPARVEGYRRDWIDEICLNGEVGWGRLYPPARDPEKSRTIASITRVAPVSIFLREDISWLRENTKPVELETLTSTAREVLDLLNTKGAMFATDVAAQLQLLPTHLDEALGELVSRGLVTADGFAGLRNLIRESPEQKSNSHGRSRQTPRLIRHRRSPSQVGRWSVWSEADVPTEAADERQRRREVVEQWAWQLLRRWGVIFKDLLQKEPGSPPWWELVQVYRRLEARGEIRGGRFIRGVAGEQFAVGETVSALRSLRNDRESTVQQVAKSLTEQADGAIEHSSAINTVATAAEIGAEPEATTESKASFVILSACDPLNLTGVIDPGPRVAATVGNRVVLHRGRYVAAWESGEWRFNGDCPRSLQRVLNQMCEG